LVGGGLGVGTGTNNPLGSLDVRSLVATNPVASFSGATTFANTIIDQSGTGDIFTASKSGATKFTIQNNCNLVANGGTFTGLDGLQSSGQIQFNNLTTDGIVTTTGGILGSEAILPVANGGSPFSSNGDPPLATGRIASE